MELTVTDLKPFLPGLEAALDDETVSEIMVNEPGTAFVERAGRMPALDAPALTAEAVSRAAVQIARPLGRDPHTEPVIDARLADGSRVAICGPPAAPMAAITIRRFGGRGLYRRRADRERLAAGVGGRRDRKRAPARAQRPDLRRHRLGQDDAAERTGVRCCRPPAASSPSRTRWSCGCGGPNCVRFEARGLGGRGVTIRDLVRHALRHRPDHIVVGEVRGAEVADLLQALNTGHGGSLATVHANNAEAALSRLATCGMQASDALPWAVVCRGVVDGIEAVIHQTRTPEGLRRVEQMVRLRDYDAARNRWVVETVWPAGADTASVAGNPAKARRPARPRRQRRR